jgi:hexulose-6-phosphate isomerase
MTRAPDSPDLPPVGFMQGRLSPMVDGRIQAFPWEHWRAEFALARALGIDRMEWTLDDERIDENPLMTPHGQREIRALSAAYGVAVPSLTGDFLMQAPFFRVSGAAGRARLDTLRRVVEACGTLGIGLLVLPVVDEGRLRDETDKAALYEGLAALAPALEAADIVVAFESDLPPDDLAAWIAAFPPRRFGINYDIGNSAALGFDPAEEMAAYGGRIVNVHVKDRRRGGTTVPLGSGAADLAGVFRLLRRAGYRGNLILQTARATDGDHAGALARYRDMVAALWREAG